MSLCIITKKILLNVSLEIVRLTSGLLMTYLISGSVSKGALYNSLLGALKDRADHIYILCSDSNSSFLDYFLRRDTAANVLQ